MTIYAMTHKSMNCPICGKSLVESEIQDNVACVDPSCKFEGPSNMKYCAIYEWEFCLMPVVATERYIKNKLEKAGFDLKKPIEKCKNFRANTIIYRQKEGEKHE